MQINGGSLPVSYHFHVMLLLVNAMFPSELCQKSTVVNLASKPIGF